MAAEAVRITFLGGLGEIGRNCAAIEIEGRIMLLDCGLMFPDADMLGVDLVLPDFRWLLDRAIYELRQLWACGWRMLRVHVAARNGIPRECLEEPPHAWMKVMQGPGDKDR